MIHSDIHHLPTHSFHGDSIMFVCESCRHLEKCIALSDVYE